MHDGRWARPIARENSTQLLGTTVGTSDALDGELLSASEALRDERIIVCILSTVTFHDSPIYTITYFILLLLLHNIFHGLYAVKD